MAEGTIQRLERAALSLEAVERRRWHLWLVAGVFLVAVSVALTLAFTDTPLGELVPDTPALRWSFLALSVAFMLYVTDQERRLRRITRKLVSQQVLTASLESRITDLTKLSRVGRLVNSVLSIEEVLHVVLEAAFELTGARTGSVMLSDGTELRVAVSQGPDAAPVGVTTKLGSGVSGWVAQHCEPLLLDGELGAGQLPGITPRQRSGGSAIVAPLIVSGDLLGVLSLERGSEDARFSDLELRSIALFAEHAATAVRNAERYEDERRNSAQLADKMQLRSQFVATVVHDLKSPLTAIIGFANMLRRRWDLLEPGQRDQAMEAIQEQGTRLFHLIDEVLRSAAIEAGATLQIGPVELRSVLTELAITAEAGAQARDGAPRLIRVEGDELTITADGEALRHVFSNLLENAVKFSPAGSPIVIRLEAVDGEAVVHVIDRGEGIEEEDAVRIFERFRQSPARAATSTSRGGVGLGLYIVHTLVDAHNGRVWVHSTPGRGSTFSVALPAPERVSVPPARVASLSR